MKVPAKILFESDEALAELKSARLPAIAALRVAIAIADILPKLRAVVEARAALVAASGTPVANEPGQFAITDMEKFKTDLDALLSEEIDLPNVGLLPVSLLLGDKVSISAGALVSLKWLIDLKAV